MPHFTLEKAEAEALRVWMAASPNKITLPTPEKIFMDSGVVASVEMPGDQTLVVNMSDGRNDAAATDQVVQLMTRLVDDAKRMLSFVPDYGNQYMLGSSFVDFMKPTRDLKTSRLLYSHKDFVVLVCDELMHYMIWHIDKDGERHGSLSWDRVAAKKLIKATDSYSAANGDFASGLGARDLPEIDRMTFALSPVHALVEKRKADNSLLLRGHTLEKHVHPEDEILYVDSDLVFSGGECGDYFRILYRREGLLESRRYDTPTGRRHAVRAAKGMAEGAGADNVFRRWVVKQDYEFDVAPHTPRN